MERDFLEMNSLPERELLWQTCISYCESFKNSWSLLLQTAMFWARSEGEERMTPFYPHTEPHLCTKYHYIHSFVWCSSPPITSKAAKKVSTSKDVDSCKGWIIKYPMPSLNPQMMEQRQGIGPVSSSGSFMPLHSLFLTESHS